MVSAISRALRQRESARKKAYSFTARQNKNIKNKNIKKYSKPEYKSHLLHLEDLIWNNGTDHLIKLLDDIINGTADISIKWDGAPAIIFGYDPADNKFFVATKSIFNKTPKLYKSPYHIDNSASLSDDLKSKLMDSYRYLSRMNFSSGIYQGDLLFCKDTQKMLIGENDEIDCYMTFQPNTILYAIEPRTEMEYFISTAKYGIAVHTQHTGSIGNLKQKYNINFQYYASDVWTADTQIALPPREDEEIKNIIFLLKSTKMNFTPDLSKLINTFHNKTIWERNEFDTPDNLIDGLIHSLRHESHIRTITANRSDIKNIYELYLRIKNIKKKIILELNEQTDPNILMYTVGNDLEPSSHEGYVMATADQCIKLVDRSQFSYKNNSDKYYKGWKR